MDFMAITQPIKPAGVPEDDGASIVLERVPQKVKPPQMHQVVLLNDDYTPMEFVVVVIQEFFSKDRETATQIMLKIHLEGKGMRRVHPRRGRDQGRPGAGCRAPGRPPAAMRERAGGLTRTGVALALKYGKPPHLCQSKLENVVSLRR
jgi:ATP-dependent Clp protease adaptor protein ClpS